MELDLVELVMSTEEHFGIETPDHIAETLFTVGDLHGFRGCRVESLWAAAGP